MHTAIRIHVILVALFWSVSLQAEPSQVDSDTLSEVLSTATATVNETFEYGGHEGANPYKIANGILRSSSPFRGGQYPLVGFASCLSQDTPPQWQALRVRDPGSMSVFSAFPDGTTLWAARLCFDNPEDVLSFSVVGSSGTLTLRAMAASFASVIAFLDADGLESVTIRNHGTDGSPASNYYYDEILTAETE